MQDIEELHSRSILLAEKFLGDLLPEPRNRDMQEVSATVRNRLAYGFDK